MPAVGRHLAQRLHVEAARTRRPEFNRRADIGGFDRRHRQVDSRRHQPRARFEEPASGVGNELDGARVEAESADLIGDQQVGALRQIHVCREAVDDVDAAVETVTPGNRTRRRRHTAGVYRVDSRRAGAAGEQTENTGARSEVEHDIAGPDDVGERRREGRDTSRVREIEPVFVNHP